MTSSRITSAKLALASIASFAVLAAACGTQPGMTTGADGSRNAALAVTAMTGDATSLHYTVTLGSDTRKLDLVRMAGGDQITVRDGSGAVLATVDRLDGGKVTLSTPTGLTVSADKAPIAIGKDLEQKLDFFTWLMLDGSVAIVLPLPAAQGNLYQWKSGLNLVQVIDTSAQAHSMSDGVGSESQALTVVVTVCGNAFGYRICVTVTAEL